MMGKQKKSNNVFRSNNSSLRQFALNPKGRGGKHPRSEIQQLMKNYNRQNQQQNTKILKRNLPNNAKTKMNQNTTGPKGKKLKPANENMCDTDILDTSFFDIMNTNQLLRSNSLSSITQDVTDCQATKDKLEIERLQKIIQNMIEKKKSKGKHKKYVVSQQFEWNVKQIVKEHIYPKVKFITCAKMMESSTDKTSIGYCFLKHYRNMELQDKIYADEELTDNEIWRHAKEIVYNTIKQKRGTVQTELKKGWVGKCSIVYENLNILSLTMILFLFTRFV